MIKVASWSRELYVDLDEYSDIVNSDVDKKCLIMYIIISPQIFLK